MPLYVQLDMIRIDRVDELSATFFADVSALPTMYLPRQTMPLPSRVHLQFEFHMAWRDDRITCAEATEFSDDDECHPVMDEAEWSGAGSLGHFFPHIDFMNSVDEFPTGTFEISAAKTRPRWIVNQSWYTEMPEGPDNYENLTIGTWMLATARVRLTMAATFGLARFPFDNQVLHLEVQPKDLLFSHVRLVASPANIDSLVPDAGPITGWTIGAIAMAHKVKEFKYSGEVFSRVTFSISVSRLTGQILNRFVIGVSFLVFMAIFSITLEPDNPNRQTMQQASFLGTVAWQYVLASSTPSSGATSNLDLFFIVAFAHIFGIFIFCSIKHGYVVTLNQIIAEGEAHARHAHLNKVFPATPGQAVAEIAPEVEGGERAPTNGPLPNAPPRSVTELACAILRGLPRYICGGAWSGMNLHHRIDFLFMCLATSSYVLFGFLSLYVL